MFFSQGCDGLVDVRVLLNNNAISPANDFIALNNITILMGQEQPVEKGDVITAHVENHDDTENHDIGVYITILPRGT